MEKDNDNDTMNGFAIMNAELPGNRIASVMFIMDYLIVDFDGTSISYLVWPLLDTTEDCLNEKDVRYRDELCKLIGVEVETVSGDADFFVVRFKNGVRIRCSLQWADRVTPEAFVYTSRNHCVV